MANNMENDLDYNLICMLVDIEMPEIEPVRRRN